MKWLIEVRSEGDRYASEYELDGEEVRLGRGSGNDLVLPDNKVSRNHLVIFKKGSDFYAEDLGSTNGTFVKKGFRYSPINKPTKIKIPAWVKLANQVELRVRVAGEAGVEEPEPEAAEPASPFSSMVVDISEVERDESIMVLDLCDSSKIASTDERMAYHLKDRLSTLSASVLEANRARFTKNTGDGFMVTFPEPMQALDAAMQILDLLDMRNKVTKNEEIHVRIALHHGKTYEIPGDTPDLHGSAVNLTFRLESLQPASFVELETMFPEQDRILCTMMFWELIKMRDVPLDASPIYCGLTEPKGAASPVRVYWMKRPTANP